MSDRPKARIRADGTLEAVLFDKGGCSHRFENDEWWTWVFEGTGPKWIDHPDPDAAWARFIAQRLTGKIRDSAELL